MATFTEKQILDTENMFKSIPKDYRGIVTGLMIGVNVACDKDVLPDMISLALELQNKQPA